MSKRVGVWRGGYVREGKNGRRVYVIERWVGSESRFHLSTKCSTEKAALRELERFELDPWAYMPQGVATTAPRLSADRIVAYHAAQLEKGLTREWANEVARDLSDWCDAIGHRDLRAVQLSELRLLLDNRWPKRRANRIKALKGYCRWLRERGDLKRDQDPALELRVPQAKPEKWRRRKVVPHEDVTATLRHLPQPTQDVLRLLAATGWHLSEVYRFASSGELVDKVGDVLAVAMVRHKSGDIARTPILYPEHLEAARRLRALGGLPKRMTLARHQRKACREAAVPWFGLGQMRHSVLTWGVERGASMQDAAEFAHHKSTATTRRFYVDLAIGTRPIPVLRLG